MSVSFVPARFTSRDTAGRILRLCLMVSLWHAPVPWLHFHEADGADGPAQIQLLKHLDVFHRDNPMDGRELGWHIHFALPWQVANGGQRPLTDEDPGSPHRQTLCEYAPATSSPTTDLSAAFCHGLVVQLADIDRVEAVLLATARPERVSVFLDTYRQSAALRDLIQVARC